MRLLHYYQLWMHDVFPKARFRDCISMTEKEGGKPHLKAMRNEFIDMTKPSRQDVTVIDVDDATRVSLTGDEERAVIETGHTDLPSEGDVEEAPADEALFVSDMSDIDKD